jgi:hypothetical protein
MATIPDRFIREKEIDFESEILSCYGVGIETHGIYLPPLTLGVMSMLELLDNKVLKGEESTIFDYAVIFYLIKKKQKALPLVAKYVRGFKRPLELRVRLFMIFNKISILSMPRIKELIDTAFTGFDMLPRGGSASSFVYGADTIAGITFTCCDKLNKSSDEVVWNTPLTLIGHITAVNAQSNGIKGVARRKDDDHLKYLFTKCKEWDEQKKLYPWQWLEPDVYHLEPYQTSREIKIDYDKRLKEYKNGKVKR